ncbi:hypothetical protein BU25DRAFT_407435 [Macroventuria anomochaeta]|uniref:Uncharacterized protein n=1 Tax=Macroventuria anomochaeta TaxID=301207 RepID=A0ACB6SFC4_9PLEO|nr:uncharacterized protein BU25DRAFT_407435 [Macroventuria anomochaeta]KAF2631792.1 hypothetical protein BU25DRAFT_407435 [Macroventuria anomochaeta]
MRLFITLLPHLALASLYSSHTAQEVISLLNLQPNVEKGYYRQTFVDARTTDGNRSVSTAIYYLLEGKAGFSYWHRVDAVEVWHHYAGAVLTLEMSWGNGTATERVLLGDDIFGGQEPQGIVPAHRWQRVRSLGEWTLVGTTMAPGFAENGFEMREDWMRHNDR